VLQITIDDRRMEAPEGSTILDVLRKANIEVPTLCHDDRLKPSGACRLCAVEIKGWARPATACNTLLADGMEIATHSAEVEALRRTLLRLLAQEYPAAAAEKCPDKQFHRLLHQYNVATGPGCNEEEPRSENSRFEDSTHPYIHIDMNRCITCFRCVRICDEVQGQFVWRAWNRGDATRLLPDGPTLLASSCVSCGACADTCPTGALEDKTVLASGLPTEWTRTTCPYCGTGCEMHVGIKRGRIVQIKPALDAPVNKGHLCVKGRYAFGFTNAPDRITEPMIRENGKWEKVSWKEAIDCVGQNLTRILEEFGPESVGVLGSARATNEENYVTQKFARVVLGTNNVDSCARVCHAPTAAAMKAVFGTGAATNSFDDIEQAAAILVCGCNPTENHPIVGARIKQAALRGAKLIVIDPRQIELAHYAHVHLQVRPGTNIALLNALACAILDEKLCDEPAVAERVSGWSEFQTFVQDYSPEKVAATCGVSAAEIRRAARLYAGARPAMCFHGLGVTEHVQGTEGVKALVNLALLTGNFGTPGSGVNPLRGQNNVQGAAHMGCEPGNLTGYVPLEQGRVLFEQVWQVSLPSTPGLNLMEMIDAAAAGRLKALWAIGYDIALTNPSAGATREALRSLDFVVVQDLFLNELARDCGTVFLPAASPFEKDGTFMNSERRVQRVRKALGPAGQSKPDWQIICQIAGAMGWKEAFAFESPEDIWNEVRSVWKAGAGITYERLERSGLQWPCPTEDHPGTTILHSESFPSGTRAPLSCIEFEEVREAASEGFPFLLTTGRTLCQFNAGTMTMRTPNVVLRDGDLLEMSPQDARRLGLEDREKVSVRSRYGEAVLPLKVTTKVKPGELFATFHSPDVLLNNVTSPERDRVVGTPQYKVVAVAVEKIEKLWPEEGYPDELLTRLDGEMAPANMESS
jgi:formate dehydrogenase major subunit